MGLAGRPLTSEDVAACRIDELATTAGAIDCADYTLTFKNEMKAAEQRCDDRCAAAYRLLFAVTSLRIRQDSRDEPLGPGLIFDGRRTAAVSDFDEEDLDSLAAIEAEISDPELGARIRDVLWLARRDHRFARGAVARYVDSAIRFAEGSFPVQCAQRAHRALALAATLGRNQELFGEVSERMKELAEEALSSGDFQLSRLLIDALVKHRAVELSWQAHTYAASASLAEQAGDLACAETCWREVSRCYRAIGDSQQELQATGEIVRVLEVRADEYLQQEPPNGFAAASLIQSAIDHLARVPDTDERRGSLTRKLVSIQQNSTMSLTQVSTEFDLSEPINAWIAAVSDKELDAAVISMAMANRPASLRELRDQLKHHIQIAPMTHLIGAAALDREGRTVARRPGLIGVDPDEATAAFEAQLFELAQKHQEIAVPCIDAARMQINAEHQFGEAKIRTLIEQSPLVPPDRRGIFTRGILEGFRGDFVTAAHILAPQLENVLRQMLRSQGVNVVQVKADGTHELFSLTRMLRLPELENILGEDYVFELRGLLTEDFGSNARNDVSHGLVGDSHAAAWDLKYLWWLALHFILLPIAWLAEKQKTRVLDDDNF